MPSRCGGGGVCELLNTGQDKLEDEAAGQQRRVRELETAKDELDRAVSGLGPAGSCCAHGGGRRAAGEARLA